MRRSCPTVHGGGSCSRPPMAGRSSSTSMSVEASRRGGWGGTSRPPRMCCANDTHSWTSPLPSERAPSPAGGRRSCGSPMSGTTPRWRRIGMRKCSGGSGWTRARRRQPSRSGSRRPKKSDDNAEGKAARRRPPRRRQQRKGVRQRGTAAQGHAARRPLRGTAAGEHRGGTVSPCSHADAPKRAHPSCRTDIIPGSRTPPLGPRRGQRASHDGTRHAPPTHPHCPVDQPRARQAAPRLDVAQRRRPSRDQPPEAATPLATHRAAPFAPRGGLRPPSPRGMRGPCSRATHASTQRDGTRWTSSLVAPRFCVCKRSMAAKTMASS